MQNATNVSNTTNSSALAYLKLQLQSIYLNGISNEFVNQVQLTFGLISFVCATCIVSTIFFTKSLRTKNYLLIAGVSVGDILLLSVVICNSALRIDWASHKTPTIWNQFQCIMAEIPRIMGVTLSKGFFFLCSMDRFMAVYKPHWYNASYPTWLFPLLVSACLFNALLDVVLYAFGSYGNVLIPVCTYTAATTEPYLTLVSTKNTTILVVSVSIYVVTIFYVYFRLNKVKKQNGDTGRARKDMQIKVIWSLALIMGCYCITIAASTITYKYIYPKPIEFQIRMALLVQMFLIISPSIDITILLWRNSDFRQSCFALFCCRKNNQINPSSLGQSRTKQSSIRRVSRQQPSSSQQIKTIQIRPVAENSRGGTINTNH